MVEARGRTGRKPTSAEKQGSGADRRTKAPGTRANRLEKPPTWRGAFVRAMAAAVLMLLISLLLLKGKSNQAIVLFPFVLAAYVPISYYTDLWLYRRRMAGKAKQAEGARAGDRGRGSSQ